MRLIPRPVVDMHEATNYSVDVLKRHITASMPVFNTADLKMPALVNLDFRAKLGKERVLRRLHGRRWQVQHNRYFAGRVSEVTCELVAVNG
ncbi:hypothetical protein [Hymenobacter persicinus]|uniref:Uncharacterized protein n=1 Tax=Hymenobacter persicinus TaxID=2025506 RepID=A0A4Q5L7W7_9BACT|nr:hypothetical protein [Hymenobacter persicinus]RYU77684.1 hypothetical protein EWM57_17315 [Hymenobacter persicinus]